MFSVLTIFWFFFLSAVLVLIDGDKIFGIKSSDDTIPDSTRLISALIKNTLPTATIALLMSILPYILLSEYYYHFYLYKAIIYLSY
jgi:hypothetical protein